MKVFIHIMKQHSQLLYTEISCSNHPEKLLHSTQGNETAFQVALTFKIADVSPQNEPCVILQTNIWRLKQTDQKGWHFVEKIFLFPFTMVIYSICFSIFYWNLLVMKGRCICNVAISNEYRIKEFTKLDL